jgi:hypothetical protein
MKITTLIDNVAPEAGTLKAEHGLSFWMEADGKNFLIDTGTTSLFADNARAMGIDITKYKLFVFTISSFFAGVAGVLYSYTQARVQTSTFDYNYSIEILVMVVLGGMGSINGSMIAAALITFINVKLQTVLTGNLSVLQKVIYALILIGIVIYRNAPGLKGFREKYNLNTLLARLLKKKANAEETDAKEEAADDGQ